jgi:hypothetical protein
MVRLRRLGVVALTLDVRAGSQPKAQVAIWHAAADAGGSILHEKLSQTVSYTW